jgi:hypothetical protein
MGCGWSRHASWIANGLKKPGQPASLQLYRAFGFFGVFS